MSNIAFCMVPFNVAHPSLLSPSYGAVKFGFMCRSHDSHSAKAINYMVLEIRILCDFLVFCTIFFFSFKKLHKIKKEEFVLLEV